MLSCINCVIISQIKAVSDPEEPPTMVFSSIADLPAENREKIRPCIAWAVSREGEKNRKEFRRHVNVEDAKMCALTNKSGMDAIHSCDYVTCVIVMQINAPLFSCYMSVSVQVIFYSDHQGCVRAVNKTLIRLLGGSDHRSDQTGIHLKFLPTCNVNSFVCLLLIKMTGAEVKTNQISWIITMFVFITNSGPMFLKRRPKNEDLRLKTPWTKTKTPVD